MFAMGFLSFTSLEKSLMVHNFIMLLKQEIEPWGNFHMLPFGHWSHVQWQVKKGRHLKAIAK